MYGIWLSSTETLLFSPTVMRSGFRSPLTPVARAVEIVLKVAAARVIGRWSKLVLAGFGIVVALPNEPAPSFNSTEMLCWP